MTALYQRARPVTFGEVVGQDHVKEVLVSAVRLGRTGHAYLFSGPRGVGKTTSARLLAMAVNCEAEDPADRPCGTCESCRLVQSGSHPDVAELDAASNNSVEDVRALRERVGLASLRGGTRVWILDEAHMLSKAAANALLKTLEEPPPGLLFVLATTEPEKLPPTILSRCQHFRFRRLTDAEIQGKLERLCGAAGVEAEPAALSLVARAADGGMRDAESLLDRLLVTGGPITAVAVEEALGLPPQERLWAMAHALADDDLSAVLEHAADLYRAGYAPRTLAEQLARTLRDALYLRLAGDDRLGLDQDGLLRLLQAIDDEHERFVRRNDLYALEVALIKGRNALRGPRPVAFEDAGGAGATMPATVPSTTTTTTAAADDVAAATATATSPPTDAGRDDPGKKKRRPSQTEKTPMTVAERSDVGVAGDATDSHAAPTSDAATASPAPSTGSAPAAAPAAGTSATSSTSPSAASASSSPSASPSASPAGSSTRAPFSWHAVKAKASTQLKAFLQPAQASLDGDEVRVVYQDTHAFHFRQLLQRREELEALIADVVGPGLRLTIDGPGGGGGKKA
ncbi:MAG: DNA polymerase III subunit gamma/tau [Trueperaceae bacterium]